MSDTPLNHIAWAEPNASRECFGHIAGVYISDKDVNILLSTTIILAPNENVFGTVNQSIMDFGPVHAFHCCLPFNQLNRFISALSDGEINPGILPFPELPTICFNRSNTQTSMFSRDHHFLDAVPSLGLCQSAFRQWENGEQLSKSIDGLSHSRWKDIEDTLPAGKIPFSDFEMLSRQLKIDTLHDWNASSVVTLVSPFWVWFEQVKLHPHSNSVEISILSAWNDLRNTSISIVPIQTDEPDDKSLIEVSEKDWDVDAVGNLRRFRRKVSLRPEVGPCSVFLNYGGRRIASESTGLAQSRKVTHELFDNDFDGLKKRLFTDPQKGNRFEEGVVWLLHLCGLSTPLYGYKDLQDAVDVVAFQGDKCVLIADCSTALPGVKENEDLNRRANLLENRLKERTALEPDLVRVFFCSMPDPKANEQHNLFSQRQENSISYLYQEQLKELVDRALRGDTAEACLEYIRSLYG